MGYKADIQATRATQASTNAVVAQPIRLKGIIAANASASSGLVVMTTTSKNRSKFTYRRCTCRRRC